jgi:glycerate-2-kinase
VPDPTTYADAFRVLNEHRVDSSDAVTAFLEAGTRGELAETPKFPVASHEVEVVANAAVAAQAAVRAAQHLRIGARIETTELHGNAETAAGNAVTSATEAGMTFFAGETTVEVTGRGSGGRNQHAALAAALQIQGTGDRVLFGALATDGVDGPTDGAGAVVDGGSVGRGRETGLDARRHLADHDAHPFLEATGDLLRIGPSGTNVGDLWVVWRR